MLNRIVPLGILIGGICLAAVACGDGGEAVETALRRSPPPPPPGPTLSADTAAPTQGSGSDAPQSGTAQTVDLQDPGGSGVYAFSPHELTFRLGETVTFTLVAEAEFHTFTVDDLEINEDVDAGATGTLTYTFDTAGTFELVCVPHQVLGMVGTITVQ